MERTGGIHVKYVHKADQRPMNHRLNMELDIQSLFGLHVYSCTHWRRTPPPPRTWAHIGGRYWSAKIDDACLWPPAYEPWPEIPRIGRRQFPHGEDCWDPCKIRTGSPPEAYEPWPVIPRIGRRQFPRGEDWWDPRKEKPNRGLWTLTWDPSYR